MLKRKGKKVILESDFIMCFHLTDSILMSVSLEIVKYPLAVNGFSEESSRSCCFNFCLSSLMEESPRVDLTLISS